MKCQIQQDGTTFESQSLIDNNQTTASSVNLELAHKEVANELKGNVDNIDAIIKQIQLPEYEKEDCKIRRYRDDYMEAKKRKQKYIELRNTYDNAQKM